jgi:hypothetical protein
MLDGKSALRSEFELAQSSVFHCLVPARLLASLFSLKDVRSTAAAAVDEMLAHPLRCVVCPSGDVRAAEVLLIGRVDGQQANVDFINWFEASFVTRATMAESTAALVSDALVLLFIVSIDPALNLAICGHLASATFTHWIKPDRAPASKCPTTKIALA